jgi:hypothetical protein
MSYQWSDLTGALVSRKYRLTEYLGDVAGNGVFGTDAENGSAILRLAPDEVAGAHETLQRWSYAAKISHPSIVRTYEAGKEELDGSPFVFTVTERPDDSLAEAVHHRPLTPDEARGVVDSMLDGLAYLHAQGSIHGHVIPENIVAVGDHVKLSPWTIRQGTDKERQADVAAAGQTIVEVLTQKRPADVTAVDFRALPKSLGKVARGCMEGRLSASDALSLLRSPVVATRSPSSSTLKLPMGVLVAALAGVVLLIFGVRSYKSRPAATESAPIVAPAQAARERTTAAAAAPPPAQTRGGNWVVVAAIYKDHDLAQKRAGAIAQKFTRWEPEVYPPAGQGARRYMVLLGRADNRKDAEKILARARAAGMPRDTYLTKIKP